ncbi:hypothetical protein [Streptomyces sp. NPDC001020]
MTSSGGIRGSGLWRRPALDHHIVASPLQGLHALPDEGKVAQDARAAEQLPAEAAAAPSAAALAPATGTRGVGADAAGSLDPARQMGVEEGLAGLSGAGVANRTRTDKGGTA